MKKINLLNLILPALVAQGSVDINQGQMLILLMITCISVVIFGLTFFLIVCRLIRIGRAYRKLVSNEWIDKPFTHWRKGEKTDLYMHTFTEQQWLFNQFLSQGHDDFETHDLLDVSHDWWS